MKIYKSEEAGRKICETYDGLVAQWGMQTQELDVNTYYGTTHVIECGMENSVPLVLFHGVGDDSALMWIYNAKALAAHFRVYAVDTMGGPGKSRPNENYGTGFDEVRWLDEVFDRLKLEKFHIAGVSNGSYMAQHYGIIRPERVMKIICMSGTIVDEGSGSPLGKMLRVFLPEALFATRSNTVRLIRKMAGTNYSAFTENPKIMEHFYWLLKGFNNQAMACHKLVYFNEEQISHISNKTLFLIGESDPLGNKQEAEKKLEHYHLACRFFPGVGHGINHENADEINQIIINTCTETGGTG